MRKDIDKHDNPTACRLLLKPIIALLFYVFLIAPSLAIANGVPGSAGDQAAKFRQLGQDLPTPNVFRTASGAPGPAYWQQQVDYTIHVALDEDKKMLSGSQTIQYTNHSPDKLTYLWVQLEQNRFKNDSTARMSETTNTSTGDKLSYNALAREYALQDVEFGTQISSVTDMKGRRLRYTINDTMMRIDLPGPLPPKDSFRFNIDWHHNIIDETTVGGRGGYEHFPDTDTYIYFLAQWFPRMAAYTDYTGWQNKQFLGRGEFTLDFGNYDVSITVPSDHIVSATGQLQNPDQVLSSTQLKRLKQEVNHSSPSYIVTPDEARENEKSKSRITKTWRFKADNVRDFAWASSRKFIWDAMHFEQKDAQNVLAMSFFPVEADPIWSQYSTQAVVHTMDVYSRFSFAYPYPTAQSVNTWKLGGMEYPMISFNGYRPHINKGKKAKTAEADDVDIITYSRDIKYGLIGVIIHEIGHIYFPMVVNSDERQWTWMDEGINTFLQHLAEYEWEENYPISGKSNNPLDDITDYMVSSAQVPIMTQSDSILKFGPNAYSKPAAALMVLRETVMGRELFDHAFKTYSERWKFKRPSPADFFRTMEDASAVDLDWFWRGWFYSTDHVDVALSSIREYRISTHDPDIENDISRQHEKRDIPQSLTQIRNRAEGIKTRLQRMPILRDFYNENDKFTTTNTDRNAFQSRLKRLKPWEKAIYDRAIEDQDYIYFVEFKNIGGLISPIPLTFTYENGEVERLMIPAEIWRRNSKTVSKRFIRKKRLASIMIDEARQTADADFSNNHYPPIFKPSRIELFKRNTSSSSMMKDMMAELDKKTETSEHGKALPLKPNTMGTKTSGAQTSGQ